MRAFVVAAAVLAVVCAMGLAQRPPVPAVEQTFYVGTAASLPAPSPPTFGHLTSGDFYLGLSTDPGGPYDPLASPVFMREMVYKFVIEGAATFYLTTDSSGGSAGTNPLNVANPNATVSGGTWMGNDHIGQQGDTLTFTVLASTPDRFYYHSADATNRGYVVKATDCVSVPPPQVSLLSPANAATAFDIGTPLKWAPVTSFGRSCPSHPLLSGVSAADAAADKLPMYRILFRSGSGPIDPLNNNTAVPAQGQRDVEITSPEYPLSSSSVEPGATYAWAIQVINGAAVSTSATFTFSTQPDLATASAVGNGTALINGAVLQERIFPDVPASFSKYKFYQMDISSPGGTLVILGSSSALQVANAPPQGAINLFVGSFNSSVPAASIRQPTSSSFEFRSSENVATTDRRSVLIPSATAPVYYVGVEASGGSATYALTAVYQCPLSAVQEDPAATSCIVCPDNMEAEFPGVIGTPDTACRCKAGFYGPVGGPCSRCPFGGLCDGGPTPSATVGFWASDADRSFFFECPVETACLGGPESRCREGYEDKLCSECADGWYKLNTQCYECPASPGFTFFIGVVILGLFLVMCVELARWYRKISSVTVTINFIQTVAVLPLYQLAWPQYLKVFFNDLSGFNLNLQLTAPECSFSGVSWSQLWVFNMFFPLIVCSMMSLVYLGVWIVRQYQLSRSVERPIKTSRAWDIIVPTYLTFLVFFYVSITQNTVSFFDCTSQGNDTYTLDASADILCYSSDWFTLLPLAVLGFLCYVIGIPIVVLVWLYLRKSKLYDTSARGQQMYRWLGPLYLRFHVQYYWWEVVVFVRKLLLIVVGSFLTSFTLFQSVTAVFILVVALWIHLLVYPYAYSSANWLEALFNAALIVLFLMGILFQSETLPDSSGLPQFVFGFAIVMFCVCLGSAVYCVARELRDVYRPISDQDLALMQKQMGELDEEVHNARTHPDLDLVDQREAPTMGPDDWSSSA